MKLLRENGRKIFLAVLKKRRIPATIRRELGDDIDGAAASCGLKSKTNDLKFFFSALSHLPLENIRSVLYNEKNEQTESQAKFI